MREIIRAILLEGLEFSTNKLFTPPHNIIQIAKSISSSSGNIDDADKNRGSGARKIVDLASGKPQNFNQMNRLLSFFRTEEESGRRGSQEWNLHGGDQVYDWVKREIGQHRDHNLSSKDRMRKAGGANNNKGMGLFNKQIMNPLNTRDRSKVS